MNKVCIRYVTEKGHTVVGVIGHHDIGKDAGEVAGFKKLDVAISDEKDVEKVIAETKPQVCLLATRSTMKDLEPALKVCGSHGIHALTIGEEAFYAWHTSPAICKELDELYKKNKCTFSGTGYQDVFWGLLPAAIVGASHKVTKLECFTQYNVDDYGKALCEAHGVGLSKEEFEKQITKNASVGPAYVWNSNEWICGRFGWKIKKTTQELLPTLQEHEIPSKSYGTAVKAGNATGMKAIVKTETTDGILIETTMVGQVYTGDLIDICTWNIHGEPNTEITVKRPATVELTCASIVNRISQVMHAHHGYVTSDKLGLIHWTHH